MRREHSPNAGLSTTLVGFACGLRVCVVSPLGLMAPLSAAATAALEGALALTHGGLTLRDDVRTLLRDYWASRGETLSMVPLTPDSTNLAFWRRRPYPSE